MCCKWIGSVAFLKGKNFWPQRGCLLCPLKSTIYSTKNWVTYAKGVAFKVVFPYPSHECPVMEPLCSTCLLWGCTRAASCQAFSLKTLVLESFSCMEMPRSFSLPMLLLLGFVTLIRWLLIIRCQSWASRSHVQVAPNKPLCCPSALSCSTSMALLRIISLSVVVIRCILGQN